MELGTCSHWITVSSTQQCVPDPSQVRPSTHTHLTPRVRTYYTTLPSCLPGSTIRHFVALFFFLDRSKPNLRIRSQTPASAETPVFNQTACLKPNQRRHS